MHQRKSKNILVYLFLLVLVSSIGNISINSLKLNKIQKINIIGLDQKDNQTLFKKLINLNLENNFLINKNKIIKVINSNPLIERYEVFIEYPSVINIKIEKTDFLAKINRNGKIFLIGSNGKLIANKNNYYNLPYIFGKPNIEDFLKFKQIIDQSKFSYNQIENLYFFPSKRWDIKLKKNILLKLPNNLTNKNLDNLFKFLENYNINKFTVVDSRIQNQIILNE